MSSGLVLRTHPDDGDVATPRIALLRADHITMEDGEVVHDWPRIVADVRNAGLNGLDHGEAAADSWYEVHAIRRRDTDARCLVLHRRKRYTLDQQQAQGVSTTALRASSGQERLAQSFLTALSGKLEILDLPMRRTGNPSGFAWITIEADDAGRPSGLPLATSDRLVAGRLPLATPPDFNVRAVFREPATLTVNTVYWIVLRGDYSIDGANFIEWFNANADVYSCGVPAAYNGSAWAMSTTDFTFKIYSTQHEAPVVMPANYDQKRLIGFFYTSSYFDPMEWRDRKAFWLIRSTGNAFENFSATVPVVRDSHIIFPHGLPVEVDVVVSKPVPGYVIVGGVPDGYMRRVNEWDGAVTGHVSVGTQAVYAGSVGSDFGGLYINTDSGTAFVFAPSWRW